LLAACWLAAQSPPRPESHFGHAIGADRTVLDWERVVSYFRALEASSDRVLVREMGKTTEGRPLVVAIIAAPGTLKGLDRYQWTQKKLADPRVTPPEEAEALIAEGKAVVLITCSIHSTEIASTHTAVEFAWRLAAEDSARLRPILDNVIVLLVPSLNPDGLDLVTQWYRKTLGTPFEGTDPPELYHKYAGHDNNRDWYFFALTETRLAVEKLHNAWRPQIHYDVHQMGKNGPRMFVPPWIDPIDPNIDPLIVQQCNQFGAGMAADLTAAGKTGVVINALYDFWSPTRHYAAYHGGLRILSESASARIATPALIRPDRLEPGVNFDPSRPGWNHPEPWGGGEWRLRDIIDYQSVAWESLLRQAALRREDLLRNFYRIGRRTVERPSPYAFVVPAGQRDPAATRRLLDTLSFGMVEIERATEPFEAGGRRYPAGSHVILLAQPYGRFARTLLESRKYPELRRYPGGPLQRPYDATAHALPLLLGVDVEVVESPFPARLERLSQARELSGAGAMREQGRRFARIAVYRSHVPSMDEGWTRLVLEEAGVPYTSAGNLDIWRGALRDRYDVILFPDQTAETIEYGFKPGTMPPEYCGGVGEGGLRWLRAFLDDGGTLIFLNRSTEYANERLGLKLKNVVRGRRETEYYSPGSLLKVALDRRDPLASGLPENIAVWSESSPAWDAASKGGVRVIAHYPSGNLLASGWLTGEKLLAGKAALVEVRAGRGRVVLFGFRPQYRAQSWQAMKILFNAVSR
jgi:hypothetical protein